jgi:hypothetical protein
MRIRNSFSYSANSLLVAPCPDESSGKKVTIGFKEFHGFPLPVVEPISVSGSVEPTNVSSPLSCLSFLFFMTG